MAQGAQLSAAVMFVRNLDRSASFYQEVLALKAIDRSTTAVLLSSADGGQLVIRSMGENAPRALGSVGIQYVVWASGSQEDLERSERALRDRSAHRDTRHSDGVTAVEGSDPDGIVVLIIYPGHDQQPLRELPTRIYAW
jgi:catechol-2,3-dioxygenase